MPPSVFCLRSEPRNDQFLFGRSVAPHALSSEVSFSQLLAGVPACNGANTLALICEDQKQHTYIICCARRIPLLFTAFVAKVHTNASHSRIRRLVGARGFEPRTSCAQGKRATRLRHAPTRLGI